MDMARSCMETVRVAPGLVALASCLLLVAAFTQAQEAEQAPEDPPAEAEVAEQPAQAASQPEASSDDPFDYEATEQISEDLSVSFPVDI
jgi:hypothetical protein